MIRRRSRICSSISSSTPTRRPPARITLDLDATDDPIHGHQEGRFFHGYYDCYCYLPLYVFCGDHLLAAKLRRANIDASAGAVEEIARIVGRIRAAWPRVKVLLRADSGFAREELMAWAEANDVDYVFGLARNARLVDRIYIDLAWAEHDAEASGPADRRFGTGLAVRAEVRWLSLHGTSARRPRPPAVEELEAARALLPRGRRGIEKIAEADFVLDGEIVIAGGSFESLQLRLHPAESRIRKLALDTPAELIVFDLVARSGISLLDRPLAERRHELENFMARGGLFGSQAWRSN